MCCNATQQGNYVTVVISWRVDYTPSNHSNSIYTYIENFWSSVTWGYKRLDRKVSIRDRLGPDNFFSLSFFFSLRNFSQLFRYFSPELSCNIEWGRSRRPLDNNARIATRPRDYIWLFVNPLVKHSSYVTGKLYAGLGHLAWEHGF